MMDRKPEVRKVIDGFSGYEVSSHGRIINLKTLRDMVLSPTLQGDLTVGLVRDGHQHRYSVKGLVARAFVSGENDIFNTPILLDGDRRNLYFENIVWRPRWFAWQYTRQFTEMHDWFRRGPIVDTTTLQQYDNYLQASIENGILCSEIRDSIYNGRRVFPTRQVFDYVR